MGKMKLPLVLVLGKPGSGKSWLSEKMASKFGLALIKPIVSAVSNPTEPPPIEKTDETPADLEEGEDGEVAASGKQVPIEVALKIEYPAKIQDELLANISRGIIIDGSCFNDAQTCRDFLQLISDQKSSKFLETHQIFPVNLEISDRNLLHRRSHQWIDLETALLYRDEQQQSPPVQFSIMQEQSMETSAAANEPEPSDEPMPFDFPEFDIVNLSDLDKLLLDNPEMLRRLEDSGTEEEEMDPGKVEKLERFELFKRNQKLLDDFKRSPVWNRVSKEIRDRMRKRTADQPEQVQKQIEIYSSNVSDILAILKSVCDSENYSLQLEACQNPLALLYAVNIWFQAIVSRKTKYPMASPIHYSSNEQIYSEIPFETAVQKLLENIDGLPQFKISNAGTYCATSIVKDGSKINGKPQFALSYLGKLYLFSTADSQKEFERDPDFYTGFIDELPVEGTSLDDLEASVLNQPFAMGKSKEYCPVMLSRGILRKGDLLYAASYRGQFFVFANNECKKLFLANPKEFLVDFKVPAPRISVIGMSGSGKRTIISKLFNGLRHFNYEQALKDAVLKESDQSLKADFDAYGDLPSSFIGTILKPVIDNSPDGFVLENFPRTEADAKYIAEHPEYSIDLIVFLETDAETALLRKTIDPESPDYEKFAEVCIKHSSALHKIREFFEIIPCSDFVSIDANNSLRRVCNEIGPCLKKWLTNRDALCLNVRKIDLDTAMNYLEQGFAKLSDFGYMCPVTLSTRKRPFSHCIGPRPVILNDTVYFLRDENSISLFLENPLKYTTGKYIIDYELPKYGILGLSENEYRIVERDLGIPRLSVNLALTMLKDQPDYCLDNEYSDNIQELNAQSRLKLFTWAISQSPFIVHGFFLDDTFLTEEIMNVISLHKIIQIGDESNFVAEKYKERYVDRFSKIEKSFKTIRETIATVLDTIFAYSEYHIAKSEGRVHYPVGFSHEKINNCLSSFGLYCPVSFVDDRELVMTRNDKNYLEYKSVVYRVNGPKQAELFTNDPEKYTSNLQIPTAIPERYSGENPALFAFKGYCPVAYAEGELVSGREDCLAQFESQVYAFSSEDKLQTFIKSPWRYNSQDLPQTTPESFLNQKGKDFSLPEYYRTTLNGIINQALLHLGREKPKLPFSSLEESAVTFVALYLKAHNPNSSPALRQFYLEKFSHFLEGSRVIKTLADMINANQPLDEKQEDIWKKFSSFNNKVEE